MGKDEAIQADSRWPQVTLDSLAQDDSGSYDKECYHDDFCIMHTSGTTGRPKGTVMHRKGIFNHLHAKIDCVKMDHNSVVAQTAGYYFVNSIWQIFCPLMVGAKIVIYDRYIMGSSGYTERASVAE